MINNQAQMRNLLLRLVDDLVYCLFGIWKLYVIHFTKGACIIKP